jgi:hypothetical protein
MFGLSICNSASLKKLQTEHTYVVDVLEDTKDFILQIISGQLKQVEI